MTEPLLAAIGAILRASGFAMTDEEPRGKGYGYFEEIRPEDVRALLDALKAMPFDTRARLAKHLTGEPHDG